MMELLLSLLWGLANGVVLGLLGGGGGLVAIPILLYVFHASLLEAIGSSLFLVTLGALPAVMHYLRKRQVDLEAALYLGLGGVLGALVGSHLAHAVPQRLLFGLLLAMMGLSAFYMLFPRQLAECEEARRTWPQSARLVLIGLGIGLLTGLLGVGGGFLLVPALMSVGKLSSRKAIASSLVIIAANSLFGLLGYWRLLPFDQMHLWGLGAGMVAGSLLGAGLSTRFSQRQLKLGFGLLLILLMILMILRPPLHGSAMEDYNGSYGGTLRDDAAKARNG